MRKLFTLLSGVLLMSSAFGQTPIMVDNLNYGTTADSLVGVATGWKAHSGRNVNPVRYITSSLSFPGYPGNSVGGSAWLGNQSGTREDVNIALTTPVTTGDIFVSFLVSVDSVTGAGDYSVHLTECAGLSCTAFKPRLSFRSVTTGTVDLGLTKASATTSADWGADDAIPFGQTFLVVLKYSFVTGATNDPASVYVITGSIPAIEPSSPTITAPDLGSADAATIAGIGLRQGSIGTSGIHVDGFRAANSWFNLGMDIAADDVTSIGFNATTSNSSTLTWTLPATYSAGDNNVLVFLKKGAAVTAGTPTQPASYYTANDDFSGTATAYENDADAKAVYKGDGTSVTITGLMADSTYHALVYVIADIDSTYSGGITADVTTTSAPVLPVVKFDYTTISFNEGDGFVTLSGTLSNPNSNPVTFDVILVGGTASSADHDFVFPVAGGAPAGVAGPLTASGNILDDADVEGDETVIVTFSNLVNCVVDPLYDTLTVTIVDNDFSHFVLGASTYTVNEGGDSLAVEIKYRDPGVNPTSVNLQATPGTATQGASNDYVMAAPVTVTFNGPADTVKTVKIKIVDRKPGEPVETFTVSLASPTNGASIGSPNSAVVSINDRASYPYLPIGDVNNVNADGIVDSLGKRYELRGVVYGINLRPAGLEYAFRDATGGIRIFNATGNLGYAAGAEGDSLVVIGEINQFNGLAEIDFIDTIMLKATGRSIRAPRHVDSLTEAEESDLVYFTNVTILTPGVTNWTVSGSGTNYDVTNGIDTFQVRILPGMTDIAGQAVPSGPFTLVGIGGQFDNSVPRTSGYQFFPRRISDIFTGGPKAIFSMDTSSVMENAGTVNIQVKLQNPAVVATEVKVEATTTGSATSGADFNFSTTTLYFAPGDSVAQNVMVSIVDDAASESDETIILNISEVNEPGSVGTMGSHTITIHDNDPTGIKANVPAGQAVSIYPNPSADKFNVVCGTGIDKVVVTDIAGKVIAETSNINNTHAVIDLGSLPQGAYLLQVFGSNNAAPVVKSVIRN